MRGDRWKCRESRKGTTRAEAPHERAGDSRTSQGRVFRIQDFGLDPTSNGEPLKDLKARDWPVRAVFYSSGQGPGKKRPSRPATWELLVTCQSRCSLWQKRKPASRVERLRERWRNIDRTLSRREAVKGEGRDRGVTRERPRGAFF